VEDNFENPGGQSHFFLKIPQPEASDNMRIKNIALTFFIDCKGIGKNFYYSIIKFDLSPNEMKSISFGLINLDLFNY
jgi:hypothetical protein